MGIKQGLDIKIPNDLLLSLEKQRSLFSDSNEINTNDRVIRFGDHLSSPRTCYSHHGIFVGDDKVIHYSGFCNGISSGCIEVTSLKKFANGNDVFIVVHKKRKFNSKESVERARTRLGEDWYNVLLNNCEHFVYWCIMGEHKSKQIDEAISLIAYVGKVVEEKYENEKGPDIFVKSINDKIKVDPKILINKPQKSNSISTSVKTLGKISSSPTIISKGNLLGATTGLTTAAAIGTSAATTTTTVVSGIVGVVGGSALATAAAPVVATAAVATAVGYGVKKLYDKFWG